MSHMEIPGGTEMSEAQIKANAQPPIDNDHVAEGCEKFDTTERQALKTILNMCDAPHWTADRRWKIRDIAKTALQ